MTLGSSSAIDFAVCTGLGVAAGSCFLATMAVLREVKIEAAQVAGLAAIRVVLFFIFGAGILSVAVVVGDTKAVRDPNSILGFVLGVVLLIPAMRLVLRSHAQA